MNDFFAPHGASIFNLIEQIEYSNLETDAEKAEFAYNKGLKDAARVQSKTVKADLPDESEGEN